MEIFDKINIKSKNKVIQYPKFISPFKNDIDLSNENEEIINIFFEILIYNEEKIKLLDKNMIFEILDFTVKYKLFDEFLMIFIISHNLNKFIDDKEWINKYHLNPQIYYRISKYIKTSFIEINRQNIHFANSMYNVLTSKHLLDKFNFKELEILYGYNLFYMIQDIDFFDKYYDQILNNLNKYIFYGNYGYKTLFDIFFHQRKHKIDYELNKVEYDFIYSNVVKKYIKCEGHIFHQIYEIMCYFIDYLLTKDFEKYKQLAFFDIGYGYKI